MKRLLIPAVALSLLAGCGTPAATTAPTTAAVPAPTTAADTAAQPELDGVRQYLLGKSAELTTATTSLQDAADRYASLAKAANYDYSALLGSQGADVAAALTDARAAWVQASPLYEQMEGIVAGTPAMAQYDVILDAGTSAEEGGEDVVPFDLTLADGRTIAKPGNLFGVTESTLWGTFPAFTISGQQIALPGTDGTPATQPLPDALVLQAGATALHQYATELAAAAQAWQPTEAEAFGALVTMVPTMTEYFDSWKSSRFVAGEASTQRDFVAISRLADIQNILGGLQVVYGDVQPMVQQVDAAQADQIATDMASLKQFVADVYAKEQQGQRFSPEDADVLGAEAQNRATAITGQIAQVAARMNVPLEQE